MRPRSRKGGTLVNPVEVLTGSGFLTEVAVRGVGPGEWQLLEPLTYEGARDLFTVPAGFHTDFASVPRWLRSIVSETGTHTRAAVLHDWLSRQGHISQSDADGIFRRVLREAGIGHALRWLMWAAVRFGSGMEDADRKEWLIFSGIVIAVMSLVSLLMVIFAAGLIAMFV